MNWPIVSNDQGIQSAYEECRRNGCSHTLAEMLAFQRPPGAKTDASFLEGFCNGNQFEKTPHVGNYYKSVADQAGVNVKGKIYQAGLAESPGDPRAWIESRDDVKRICEERGWGCDGSVTLPVRNVKPPDEIDVADDILEDHVQDVLDEQPVLAPRRGELKEEIREQIKPHWAK